jgi:hypothetical protein
MSAERGALPEMKARILPPVRARSFEKTSRSASFAAVPLGPALRPAIRSATPASPTRFAQRTSICFTPVTAITLA